MKYLKLNKLFTTLSVVSATLAHFRHFKLQTYYEGFPPNKPAPARAGSDGGREGLIL